MAMAQGYLPAFSTGNNYKENRTKSTFLLFNSPPTKYIYPATRNIKFNVDCSQFSAQPSSANHLGGGGGTPLYKPFRYALPQSFGPFGLKLGIHFAHFGLESGMVFEETKEAYERIIVSIPHE